MYYEKIKRKLSNYSTEELKDLLGRKLVDLLLEWTPDNQPLVTKEKLSEMIMTVHGVNILSRKEFRHSFLRKFTKDEILSFRPLLNKRYIGSEDLSLLINIISSVKWKDNDINRHLLKILDLSDEVFSGAADQDDAVELIINSEQFFELLDYQFVIKQRVINHLISDVELNRMLVHMPTGTGKTKTAMHIVTHYFNFVRKRKGLIIWMAHTTELLYQAYDTFKKTWRHLGHGEINTHKLWGDFDMKFSEEELDGIMFCGFQKLISISKNNINLFNKLVNDCVLIIVDEAHKVAAQETKSVIDKLMIKKSGMRDRALIGLTATPGRSNVDTIDNNRLISIFDNKSITIDSDLLTTINLTKHKAINANPEKDIIKYFQERKILSKIKRHKLTYSTGLSEGEIKKLRVRATSNGYEDFSENFLKAIGLNKNRNMAILNKIVDLSREKIPTIIFACSVEHGKLLSTALSFEGIENGCVFGELDPFTRKRIINRFKDRTDSMNILINYEVLTTGFDATNIECVFITRPTQSVVLYSQMLGRGLRGPQMGGNEECLLVDVEDNLTKYNESMAYRFFDDYWNN